MKITIWRGRREMKGKKKSRSSKKKKKTQVRFPYDFSDPHQKPNKYKSTVCSPKLSTSVDF